MTVKELKTALGNYSDDLDVRLALNPHWGYEIGVGRLKLYNDMIYIIEDGKSRFLKEEEIDALLSDSENNFQTKQ